MRKMPPPLDPRRFYSNQQIQEYQNSVAAFLAQQEQAEYNHSQNLKRKPRHNPKDY